MYRLLNYQSGLLLLLLLKPFGACAQNGFLTASPRHHPLFSSDSVISFTLTAALPQLLKDRGDAPSTHPATLTYRPPTGEVLTLPVKLQVRGNFRKLWNNCSFPPLYVDIPKKKAGRTLFAHQDKLKLITHCEGEEYVVREYLVYRFYNLLTDYSFRARLCRVNYVDSTAKRPPETRWAMLLEDEAKLSSRVGGRAVEGQQISMAHTDSLHMATLAVFEYVIGNTDWSVPYRHNIRLLQVPTLPHPVPIPYDFDQSGIVDAFYASPSLAIGTTSVRERVYRSIAFEAPLFHRVFERFKQLKPQIYALYTDNPYLDSTYVKRTLQYLDEFYLTITNPDQVFLGRTPAGKSSHKPSAPGTTPTNPSPTKSGRQNATTKKSKAVQ